MKWHKLKITEKRIKCLIGISSKEVCSGRADLFIGIISKSGLLFKKQTTLGKTTL
jgi:hypothetical protein